jgi:hypothetical protein
MNTLLEICVRYLNCHDDQAWKLFKNIDLTRFDPNVIYKIEDDRALDFAMLSKPFNMAYQGFLSRHYALEIAENRPPKRDSISVNLPDGKTIQLCVKATYTVRTLTRWIDAATQIPSYAQTLLFSEQLLDLNQTLWSSGIRDGSVIKCQVGRSGDYQILVRLLTGRYATFEVKASYLTEDLKDMIRVHERIPPSEQRLIISGHQLEDGDTMADYGVKRDSTVQLILRLRGG